MSDESVKEGPLGRRSFLKSGPLVGAGAAEFAVASNSIARPAYAAEGGQQGSIARPAHAAGGVQQDWFWCQNCRAYCSMTVLGEDRPGAVLPADRTPPPHAVPVKWLFKPSRVRYAVR
jgi:hypothetical protein